MGGRMVLVILSRDLKPTNQTRQYTLHCSSGPCTNVHQCHRPSLSEQELGAERQGLGSTSSWSGTSGLTVERGLVGYVSSPPLIGQHVRLIPPVLPRGLCIAQRCKNATSL